MKKMINKIIPTVLYHLIDSRGGYMAAQMDTNDLNTVDEDWERFILFSSNSKREICHHANIRDYGDNCVVAENNMIRWDWYSEDGKWKCN
jgi:hypothetical protein